MGEVYVAARQSVSLFTRYSCTVYVGADFLLDHPIDDNRQRP